MNEKQILVDRLRNELPPIFTRKIAAKHLGGVIARGTLANLDSKGIGPGGVKGGKHRIYERDSFLAWFEGWLSREDGR